MRIPTFCLLISPSTISRFPCGLTSHSATRTSLQFEAACAVPTTMQGRILEETFNGWRGNFQQVDDILVMGIRFS